jgi:hypothetical protein
MSSFISSLHTRAVYCDTDKENSRILGEELLLVINITRCNCNDIAQSTNRLVFRIAVGCTAIYVQEREPIPGMQYKMYKIKCIARYSVSLFPGNPSFLCAIE